MHARVLSAALLVAPLAAAQNPISWKLERAAPAKPAVPNGKLDVILTADIEEGWHLYSITQPPGGPVTTRIWMPDGQPFQGDGAIQSPAPLKERDPNFDMEVEYYEGQAVFTIPVKVSAAAPAGAQKLRVNAIYQSCNEKMCLPPRTVRLDLPIDVQR